MNTRLYVGNLPLSATEEDLKLKFGLFGTVRSAIIVRDVETGRSRRFGYIEMSNDAEALTAITRLNMTQYEDAVMSVSRATMGLP